MIGNRAQRLIGRTVVTAAVIAAMVVLIVIFIRSGGDGTGAGAVTLRENASRGHAGSGQDRSAGGGSGGPPTTSGQQGEEAGKGGAPSVDTGGPPTVGATGTFKGPVIEMLYGPVQVAVVEQNGRITDVKALQLPT